MKANVTLKIVFKTKENQKFLFTIIAQIYVSLGHRQINSL